MAEIHLQQLLLALEKSLSFFRPHHLELRKRIIWILISIGLCTCLAYFFAEQLTSLFISPLIQASPLVEKLVYTNLPEAFIAYLKIAFLVGFLASTPVIIYQFWAFISPGLHTGERKLAITVTFWATLLFFTGSIFSFLVVLPYLLEYFMSYASLNLEPLPKFGAYLSFVARMMLTFGLAFEIPFLMVITSRSGVIQADYFQKKRLPSYIAITVLAFLLSAGELMATALLTLPLFALYEIGIWGCNFSSRKSSD